MLERVRYNRQRTAFGFKRPGFSPSRQLVAGQHSANNAVSVSHLQSGSNSASPAGLLGGFLCLLVPLIAITCVDIPSGAGLLEPTTVND